MRPKPLIVGEVNGRAGDPRYALYPRPRHLSGGRLCHKIMQITEREYLTRFDRVNLCTGEWDPAVARAKAFELLDTRARGGQAFVLLGRKVAAAFGFLESDGVFAVFPWSDSREHTFVLLPHPSGLCRTWNEPCSYARARRALRDAGVL